MKDLTHGSIVSHILSMAPPIVAGMVTIMICQLVDLYFVAGLGEAAIAGVAAAGNRAFSSTALMQVLGVGTVALIAHAVGRKDRADANLVSTSRSAWPLLFGLLTLVAGSALSPAPTCAWWPPTKPPSRRARLICSGSCPRWRCNSPRK